jgi:hypothetical protein
MTLQQEESPIDHEIVNELVALTPETWRRVALEVEYSSGEHGKAFAHTIFNPDGLRDVVEPSELIYSATFRLQQVFRKYGGFWKKALYIVEVTGDGDVHYKVEFETEK